MNTTLALLAALLLPAQDDVWKSLKLGDRVQVVFRSGNMLTGQLTAKPGDPRNKVTEIDYTKATEITLDVTLEYPGLNGSLSIARKEIKEVRKLQNLDAATMKRLQEELKKVQDAAAADEAARKIAEGKRDADAQAAVAKAGKENQPAGTESGTTAAGTDEARLKAGMELLARFPPPEWGAHRVQDIAAKALRKQPITLIEKEFADNIGLWTEALSHRKAEEEKKKKGAAPEKSPEKTPETPRDPGPEKK